MIVHGKGRIPEVDDIQLDGYEFLDKTIALRDSRLEHNIVIKIEKIKDIVSVFGSICTGYETSTTLRLRLNIR
jgi:hypothetical protein